jgi:hypothetical protein
MTKLCGLKLFSEKFEANRQTSIKNTNAYLENCKKTMKEYVHVQTNRETDVKTVRLPSLDLSSNQDKQNLFLFSSSQDLKIIIQFVTCVNPSQ